MRIEQIWLVSFMWRIYCEWEGGALNLCRILCMKGGSLREQTEFSKHVQENKPNFDIANRTVRAMLHVDVL
jgi:hypothetical protein